MGCKTFRSPAKCVALIGAALSIFVLPALRDTAAEPLKNPNARAASASSDSPYQRRLPAPGLTGGVDWLNTDRPIELENLRGKFVLLDFWTYCCINCLHVLPELKKLERTYANELVVVGVHSAKFAEERDSDNIRQAILRHGIRHPVVNDAAHQIWQRYGVQVWPSFVLIDPEGFVVWSATGETRFEQFDAAIKRGLPYYKKRNLLDVRPLRFQTMPQPAEATPLRFPGKVLADEAGERLFIADSNHNRIVVATLAGKLLYVIGNGSIGHDDGPMESASFNHPQGMALAGEKLYVADTENHLLRVVDLEKREVRTIAGTGEQAKYGWPGYDPERAEHRGRWAGPPLGTALASPWALWADERNLYIAMAGTHQIWKMPLDRGSIGPYAGSGLEDVVDGRRLPATPYAAGFAAFAQPSGLTSDGTWLFVADSEGSSIRAVPLDRRQQVRTVVGTAGLPQNRLFTFGDVDGRGAAVRLQHPLGVAFYGGKLYVADTYNHKIKQIDPATATCVTLAGTGWPGSADRPAQFYEPGGISAAAGKLFVADTNNHKVRVVDLENGGRVSTLEIAGLAAPRTRDGEK